MAILHCTDAVRSLRRPLHMQEVPIGPLPAAASAQDNEAVIQVYKRWHAGACSAHLLLMCVLTTHYICKTCLLC